MARSSIMGGVETKAGTGAALRAVTDAVLGLAGEPSLDTVPQRPAAGTAAVVPGAER